jgi:hypothetical protein
MKKEKKLTYRQRWLKEHPDIHIHLPKNVYLQLKKLETILGKHKNDIVKDMINGLVINFQEYRDNIMKDIINEINTLLFDFPDLFYRRYIKPKQEWFFFFTIPCRKCGKPIEFTHKDPEAKKIFKRLVYVFQDWYTHTECEKEQ